MSALSLHSQFYCQKKGLPIGQGFKGARLDVLLITRARAEIYPPTVNQANLLACRGLNVGIVDLSGEGIETAVESSIRRWHAHRAWNSKTEPRPSFTKRWINWLSFHRTCQRVMALHKPSVVLAYDILACVFAKPVPARHRTVYHFHELPEPEKGEGLGPRWGRGRTARFSQESDLVLFSDAERARIYKEESGLRDLPRVVMNCPRRIETVPTSPLAELLKKHGKSGAKTVCYLGSVGRDQGVLEAASSMKLWPQDAILVLIGPYSEHMKTLILQNASGAANKVIFLGLKPHHDALALAAGGDVGISLIQPNTRNWLYSAGAINKRFEYMALGLPQITSNGPGVAEIVDRNQCGLCVEARSSEAIGAAVQRLLEDDALRSEFSRNARASHLRFYNYEKQFAEVGEWIESACRTLNVTR